jgi:hypothetical protein
LPAPSEAPAPAAPRPPPPLTPAPAAPPVATAAGGRPGDYLHDGLYARFWAGFSYARLIGTSPPGAPSYGGPGVGNFIAVGGTVSSGFVVAATLGVVTGFETLPNGSPIAGNVDVSATLYGVLLDWFPDPRRGGHLGGSVGLSRVTVADGAGYTAGFSVHGGYDFWMTENWSAGLLASVMATPSVQVNDGDGPTSYFRFVPLAFTFCATVLYH